MGNGIVHGPAIVSASRPSAIETAVAALSSGKLVAIPTETVYGLAADARNPAAVGAIFLAKGRPRFNPLIIHLASMQLAQRLAAFPFEARALAEAFWPGPLTLVLDRLPDSPVADLALAGLPTIAIRIPSHPVARQLLSVFDGPVAAPSANRSGRVSPTTAEHVAADLGASVSVILDGGPAAIGLESTIIGFAEETPVLLRAGGIPRRAIEAVLGKALTAPTSRPDAPVAPGMLASHYAPRATLRLGATSVGPDEALLTFGPILPAGWERARAVINLSESGDPAEAAARFFAALRELDRAADIIAVAPIPESGLGEAINDRLRRAAAPRAEEPVSERDQVSVSSWRAG